MRALPGAHASLRPLRLRPLPRLLPAHLPPALDRIRGLLRFALWQLWYAMNYRMISTGHLFTLLAHPTHRLAARAELRRRGHKV